MSLGDVLPMPGTTRNNRRTFKSGGGHQVAFTETRWGYSPLNVNSSVFLVSGSFNGWPSLENNSRTSINPQRSWQVKNTEASLTLA